MEKHRIGRDKKKKEKKKKKHARKKVMIITELGKAEIRRK